MTLVPVARLVGVFGIRGELKCRPTPAGKSALAAGQTYALGAEEDAPRVRCTALRGQGTRTIVALEGVSNPDEARKYVGRDLYADRERIELGANEYLDVDLIGLRLLDPQGRALGEVVGVEHFPAQDCLVIGPERALVPLVRAFLRAIDLDARTIVMDLPEGLL